MPNRSRCTRTSGVALAVVAVFLGSLVPGMYLGAEEVPSDLEAVILLRALSYDRNLQRRSAGAIAVGVVHGAGQSARGNCGARMSAAFNATTSQTLKELNITVSQIEFQSMDQLESEVTSQGVNTLYVCRELRDRAGDIAALSRTMGLVTLCGSEELVKKGLAIGVAPKGDTAKILVNVRAARDQGADLDSRLLMMAELVR